MFLGQRLVESKLVTVEQVQLALQLQAVQGGRLGSCLLKRGFIDLDSLSAALSRHTGAPEAKLKHFDGADQETLQLVPAAMALKHRAVPLAVVTRNGKELLVALRDPHDVAAIDEIAFVAGARVHAFIAPELLIHRYLEKYYHVHPDAEFPLMAHQQRAASKNGRPAAITLPPIPSPLSVPSMPANTLSDVASAAVDAVAAVMNTTGSRGSSPLMRVANAPTPKPAPAPWSEEQAPILLEEVVEGPSIDEAEGRFFHEAEDLMPEEAEDLMLEEPVEGPLPEDLPAEMQFPPPESAWESPPLTPAAMSKVPAAFTPPMLRPPWEMQAPASHVQAFDDDDDEYELEVIDDGPLDTAEALAAMQRANDREEVGEALVRWLSSSFSAGLVLIVKDEIAFGWTGFADHVDSEVIESIMVPMNAASVLATAYTKKAPFKGSPSEAQSTAQTHFYKLLKSEPPAEALVVPIAVKDRVINLIYAHAEPGALIPPGALEDLRKLAAAASEAFIAVIKKRKSMF